VPIYVSVDGRWTWHPLTTWIIDHFGKQKEVLSAIASNMRSFGWSGSLVPYLQKQIEVLELIRHHSFPEVRLWAISFLSHLREEIERERIRDEEARHGIRD
jgi:hypothetical protein